VHDVRFGLLGPLEIRVAGQPVPLPGTAERALLAQLLLSPGRSIPATVLVDRLWSESSLPVDPMNALQIRVSKLRRSLRAARLDDVVSREGAGYRAHVEPASVDAVDFVQRVREVRAATSDAGTAEPSHLAAYDEALALWRGEPLSDFDGEQWAGIEAARLREQHLLALTGRAEVALGLGRHQEVVSDLEPVVANDPTLESLAGLLMVALYRGGRQADALEVFTRTRHVLDESLGLEPSVSLRSLHERVLRQDESLGAQRDVAVPAPTTAPPVRRTREDRVAPTNLPTVARALVGREEQLDALTQLVSGVRLLSLVGPGGAGKTALALTGVVRVAPGYPDGVFGVRLASVGSGSQVPLAVADALGVPLDGAAGERDVRERLVSYLSRRHLLLLLDNCEHVVDAVAGLVDDVLGRCPDVTVLATSREALAVPDEVQMTVGPLEVPPEGTPAARVLEFPAVQLLVERVRSVRPGTIFGAEELLALARISRALDGIPLALELAAARTSSMSPSEMADRLDQRFALLTQGARTAEARQQTLRATVDWSHALLSETEQRVFARLSVFQGGWTLSASEAVVTDPLTPTGVVLDTVGRLVERSMVVAESGPVTRFRMLETLRHYAAERLAAAGEEAALAERHAAYYAGLAREAEVDLRGHRQRQALDRLRADQPNVRAALAWWEGSDGDVDQALAMAGALGLFWHLGRHLEGREVLARVLGRREDASPDAVALALQAVSLVERPRACLVHPSPRCSETAAESLALFEEFGDASRAALSRVLLAVEGVTGRDRERSERLLADADAQFERDGDLWGRAVIGFVRMETALKGGEPDVALPVGRSTAAAFRRLDDPWGLSAILYHLGWGLRQFGRYDEAARTLEEAIDVAQGAGLFNTVQWALADLGVTSLHLGDQDAASRYFDRAAAASEHVGDDAGVILAGHGRGLIAQVRGAWPEAREHYLAAREGFVRLATPVPEGLCVAGVARCDEGEGRRAEARDGFEQALSMGRAAGEPGLVATALEGVARLLAADGRNAEAAELLSQADETRQRGCRPAPPHELRDVAGLRTSLRKATSFQ
jgi:predicted ATPase/DNA-binding SARP family transcriptional activator